MEGSTVEFRGMEEIDAMVARLPGALFDCSKQAFATATFKVHSQVTGNLQGNPLQSRTGTLGRSITPEVRGSSFADLYAGVYSDVVYARVQEYGGTIRAKDKYLGVPGGPYLNIPTDANKTAAGVMRKPAREVFNAGGYIAKTGSGRYGVFLNGEMMFILIKSVTLQPRLGLRQAAEDSVQPLLAQLDELLLKYLQTGAAG